MIIGYARVSTTAQNLGLRYDDVKPAFDASVDPTTRAAPHHSES
jgi:DNA invertase Pin-like site-specific DNA recombinase